MKYQFMHYCAIIEKRASAKVEVEQVCELEIPQQSGLNVSTKAIPIQLKNSDRIDHQS